MVLSDVKAVGYLYDGQTIFRFRVAGDPRFRIGLIAHGVECPDYERATDRAAAIAAEMGVNNPWQRFLTDRKGAMQ
jgi:hypothetical protein